MAAAALQEIDQFRFFNPPRTPPHLKPMTALNNIRWAQETDADEYTEFSDHHHEDKVPGKWAGI